MCVCGWVGGGEEFVVHCHSVMDEYETIQIFKISGGRKLRLGGGAFQGPHSPGNLYMCLLDHKGKDSTET